jgi:hypothetical protein
MRIAVSGLAKSGTTAVYYKPGNSLGGVTSKHFECYLAPEVTAPGADNTLVKYLYRGDIDQVRSYRDFDKRVAIIRDPRDRLVSAFLYSAGMNCNYLNDRTKLDSLLSAFRMKESGHRVGLVELMNIHRRNSGLPEISDPGAFDEIASHELALKSDLADYFVFRFDDLVVENFSGLESYLGFELEGAGTVDAEHSRVVRAKGADNWRMWLTEDDVEMLRDAFDPVVGLYGWD